MGGVKAAINGCLYGEYEEEMGEKKQRAEIYFLDINSGGLRTWPRRLLW